MKPLKAHVQNQRLLLDEPMDLPDGTVVELVSIDDVFASGVCFLDDEERAALNRELDASFDEEESGQLVDVADVIVDLKTDPGGMIVWVAEIKMPSLEEWNARETKFRSGAHHAVTRLAEALDEMTSAKDCRRLANVFADIIGRARVSEGDFDLNKLIAEAKRTLRSGR